MPCTRCGAEENLIEVLDNNEAQEMCVKCANKGLQEEGLAYFKGKYYTRNHNDITLCNSCSVPIHKELYKSTNGYCMKCAVKHNTSSIKFCPECGVFHLNGICDGNIQDTTMLKGGSLSFTIRNDSLSRSARGEATSNDKYIKSINQFQTERDLPGDVAELLEKFYNHCKVFKHYYTREPVCIKGEVKYSNLQALKNVMEGLDRERRRLETIVNNGGKLSKYHNCKLQGIDDDGLVKWKYIDIMGNIRERSESINKFFDEFKIEKTNNQMAGEFVYVLSSDLRHKVAAFNLNEKVHSCQKRSNSDSYARGAYDAITNGCNCPILLYTPGSTEPFARITTRIMYDKQGQEYILIDRLYHSGQFSDTVMKGEVYKGIVKDLKNKGYKVIASNYSAHDNSTYSYLASLGMKSSSMVEDLCQPLRVLNSNCGYYCDGGTIVRKGIIDGLARATDYLDKAYVL